MFLYVFSSLQRVVLFFLLGSYNIFWLFWVRKPAFLLSLSLSLSQCEHSGLIFFVLQLIGFHTCKRYCLQEKEQYVWKSDHRDAYIYSALLICYFQYDLQIYIFIFT